MSAAPGPSATLQPANPARRARLRGRARPLRALALLLCVLSAPAQETPPAEPGPDQRLFQVVKINPWVSIPRHAGNYPALQLAWQKVGDVTDVSGVWPHPLLSARAVVATVPGLLLTEDAGRTFKPLPQATAERLGAITDVAFPLDDPDAFLVATRRKGVWATADNGRTFRQVGSRASGLAGDSVVGIEVHAGDLTGRTLLACHGDSAAGLSRSVDGGHTWDVLHKEHHLFRTYTARAATEGIFVAAARTSDPEAQGLYVMPSLGEPWLELARDTAVAGFASPLLGDDAVLVATADRGLLRIARGGGVVKRIGPEDADTWAAVGAIWGPTADSQVLYAYDPRGLGMIAWAHAAEGEGSELLRTIPVAATPVTHSRGLYTNAIVREGAQLRANAAGSVFYAAVNSMLYRAPRGAGALQITEASVSPAVNRFDPSAQQNSLDLVRDALGRFPRAANPAEAGPPLLEALKAHDQAMAGQRIVVRAKVRAAGPTPPAVSVDLSRLGLSVASPLLDDGRHDDGAPGDGVYANAFPLALLSYRRQDKDWRRPWPGVVGLTVTAAGDNGALAGEVVPYSIVNPGGGAPFWEREQWHDIGVEQGKIKRGTAVAANGRKRGVMLGIETPGPWRARLSGTRKTLDISGAAALVLNIRTAEDSADDILVHLRDEPVFAQPVTTPGVPLLAEGLVPAKKFNPTYQRVVIPMRRLLKDADEFQPGILHSIVLSGKAVKPIQIMVDEAVFSYVEPAEKAKVAP